MKIVDMLMFRRSRLNKREEVIAGVLVVALIMVASGVLWVTTGQNHPKSPHAPSGTDGMEYPVQPPGFTVSAHALPADAKAEIVQLVAIYLGPSGTYFKCNQKFYYLVPYQQCTLLFQPGTTRAIQIWLDKEQGNNSTLAVAVIAGTAGAVCLAMGLGAIAYICGAFGYWFGQHLVSVARDASAGAQCLRFDWNFFPSTSAYLSIQAHIPPVSLAVSKYGKWEQWVWITVHMKYGDEKVPFWTYPTSCLMPKDCEPRPDNAFACIV
jgi:hypothetical protein